MSNRTYRLPEDQRDFILRNLRFVDDARKALEGSAPDLQAVRSELKKCADGIYHLLNRLEEVK